MAVLPLMSTPTVGSVLPFMANANNGLPPYQQPGLTAAQAYGTPQHSGVPDNQTATAPLAPNSGASAWENVDPFGGAGTAPTAAVGNSVNWNDPAQALAGQRIAMSLFPQLAALNNNQQGPQPNTPPTTVTTPTIPQVHANLAPTDNWENPAAVANEWASGLATGRPVSWGEAETAVRQRGMDQALLGNAAGQTMHNLVAAGIPIPQAAAMAREAVGMGTPGVAMSYASTPAFAADAANLQNYGSMAQGQMANTSDTGPLNNFLALGGGLAMPFQPQHYDIVRNPDGTSATYEQQAGGPPRGVTDVSQLTEQTPQSLMQMRAQILSAMFNQRLQQQKETAAIDASYYRNGANAQNNAILLRAIAPYAQTDPNMARIAQGLAYSMIGAGNPAYDNGGDSAAP